MFALAIQLIIASLVPHVLCLWPIPRSLHTGTTAIRLSNNFNIKVDISYAPKDLFDAVTRTTSFIRNDKHQRLVVGRGELDRVAIQRAKVLWTLTLTLERGATVRSIAEEAVREIGTRNESYVLSIPGDGSAAVLTANSTLGLFRGLTTFSQLWFELNEQIYTLEAPIEITDSPAYPYRGFMLDTARNFIPVPDIKRTLDAMSWVKLNTFHWHVVDSQSFPLEVPEFPELSERGAYSPEEVYFVQDVQDIIEYASARGIDVLMEIDMPGHTAVIANSHPEHIACNTASPWSNFAAEPPSGQLRLASPVTTHFTALLLSNIAKRLPSKLFSTGGDEVNMKCYARDEQTQRDLKSSGRTLEQALDVFTRVTHWELLRRGKIPVVWEEMVLNHKVKLSCNTVVMVWTSSKKAAAVAAKNFHIVHAPSDYFYLDCGGGGWMGDNERGNSWCEPLKTWQKAYTFDPLRNLRDTQKHLVLGGQQLLWTEQSSSENLDSIVWPRAASSAEVFWTGPNLPNGTPRNVASALPRLHDLRYRMVRRGVKAIALQPHWCALRPGACDRKA